MLTPFDGIVGHGAVVALLERDLADPAHAYLFIGPAHVGKGTVARRFAAALVAAGDEAAYRRAAGPGHPDLVVVEAEGRTAITVEQARRVVAGASRAPFEAGRKVFLFEEAGAMNDEAANALLKTLEEPSPDTVFVLATESEDDLPETVASRCRTVVFGRVAGEDLVAGLVARGVDPERAAEAAHISGGRPGLALALATREEAAGFRRFWLSVPLRLSAHPGEAVRLAEEAVAAAEPLLDAVAADDAVARRRAVRALHETGLEILVSFYRDAAAAQLGAPVRNPDLPPAALTHVGPAAALAASDRVFAAVDALRSNQRPALALAALFSALASDG